jgi:hypothetical protein|tara:strand:+ start:675 stop:974 length:300 start_codon:yes stop_codon:yes gene_type:complete
MTKKAVADASVPKVSPCFEESLLNSNPRKSNSSKIGANTMNEKRACSTPPIIRVSCGVTWNNPARIEMVPEEKITQAIEAIGMDHQLTFLTLPPKRSVS